MCLKYAILLNLLLFKICACNPPKPNIIFIMADDLGWNDVGFHGSNEIRTPNIDALAYSGIPLHNYYVNPICTPSRSALMTGKDPIHTGMQHTVIYGAEPRGLPLTENLLPQYLKDLGYATHLVGKWHLGSYKREYTPLFRGFDSHLGFWTGKIDYYDHTNVEHNYWGYDLRRGMDVAFDLFGEYVTDIYTKDANKLIRNHDSNKPLFLMLSHSAVHSGNPYTPLRAPDEVFEKFANISDNNRRRFAAMLSKLDDSVGEVVEALAHKNILQNSIIIFSTDNGGPAEGFNDNAASNYPLRGVKNTLWEGGVRGAALLWISPTLNSPSIPNANNYTLPRISTQLFHISDWLPSLYYAAGGDVKDLGNIDGKNVWDSLVHDKTSPRTEMLHNIDDIWGSASLTSQDWKIHKGTNYKGAWDGWYGPSERNGTYNIDLTYDSKASMAIKKLNLMPEKDVALQLREKLTLKCNNSAKAIACQPLVKPCLFHVKYDPCEQRNLAESEPEKLEQLLQLLERYNKTAVPPTNLPDDPNGDPKHWNYVYTDFGDYEATTCGASKLYP